MNHSQRPATLYRRGLAVAAVDLLHGVADLLHGGVGAHGFEGRVHCVLTLFGGFLDRLQAILDLLVVAALFELFEALYLRVSDLLGYGVGLDVGLFLRLVYVDVHDVALLFLYLSLEAGGGLGDLTHLEAVLYSLHDPAHIVYLLAVLVRLTLELVGQSLDEVRPAERVYGIG